MATSRHPAESDDLILGLLLLVLGGARVAVGLACHEVFGVEATLALVSVVLGFALAVRRFR